MTVKPFLKGAGELIGPESLTFNTALKDATPSDLYMTWSVLLSSTAGLNEHLTVCVCVRVFERVEGEHVHCRRGGERVAVGRYERCMRGMP